MELSFLITQIKANRNAIYNSLQHVPTDLILYKPSEKAWCLLHIICHLVDEEREDFRARVQYSIENPETSPPPFDPLSWVTDRKYLEQDFEERLETWSNERANSVEVLENLSPSDFRKGFDHQIFGRMDAMFFLRNWLAHDYLHIRQITRNKYQYLAEIGKNSLEYAGNW